MYPIDYSNENLQCFKELTDASLKALEIYSKNKYNIEKIHKYLDFLFTKCAPFQVGDKVELIKAPIIDDDNRPGWRSYKNMLVVGATATVETVDVNCNKFIALVKFDNQFWTHYDYKLKMGIDTPLQEDVLFTFSEDYLKVICNYNHSDGI